MHLRVLDIDGGRDLLAHGDNLEIELIGCPAGLHLRASRDMLLQFVDVAGDPATSLVLAKPVRQIDFDRLCHDRDVACPSALFKQRLGAIVESMRATLLLAGLIAGAGHAQPPEWRPGMPWMPTEPYVVIGQDEPGYRNWYLASPAHGTQVKALNDYLTTYQVGGIVPTWQLLRTASDWYKCGAPAFEVPPTTDWPNLVQTLRYIRDKVIPTIGPVEPVSVYRNPTLNQCAGGAQESAHRYMQAVDMVPLRPITREQLIHDLCVTHARTGESYGVGLGFYVGLRFHIDSRKFRTWGVNDEGTIACARSYQLAHSSDQDAATASPRANGTPQSPTPAPEPEPQPRTPDRID